MSAALVAAAKPLVAGLIVVHAAFPAVLANYPERADAGVAGYVAVDDCGWMRRHLVLVRPGLPDVLVAVADCAQAAHVPYRRRMRYIADVDASLWTGPWRPQAAELWTPPARALFLANAAGARQPAWYPIPQ